VPVPIGVSAHIGDVMGDTAQIVDLIRKFTTIADLPLETLDTARRRSKIPGSGTEVCARLAARVTAAEGGQGCKAYTVP
jgi:hypothetical protein